MAVFQGSFYAESLGMQTLLTVILPQNLSQKDGEGRFPVLFLLLIIICCYVFKKFS